MQNKMKFVFIYPPGDSKSLDTDKTSSLFAPPLGILYIASILKNQGHVVEVIDGRAERLNRRHIKDIIKFTDVVGITIPTFSFNNANSIVKTIREINEDVFIIGGGPHCSLFPEKILDAINLDGVVKGEAECTMQQFPEALRKGELGLVPGLFYKKGKLIKKAKPSKVIDDLDKIPFPLHNLVKKYDYGHHSGFKPFNGKFTSMITSRGCPYRCSFCSRDLFIKRRYRQRSAENVLQEIEYAVNQGFNGIIFVDDNFLLDRKRTIKIMDGIIDRDLDLKIIVEGARVDSADEILYSKMWDAGVRLISYGIESGNREVLDFYNKNISLDQVRKAVKLGTDTGFFTTGSFIIGAPFETKKHIKNTIDFACSLPLDFAEFYVLEYRVGSDLWKDAVDKGILKNNDYFVKGCRENNLGLISLKELKNLQKKARLKFYLRPSYLFREGVKTINRGNVKILKAGFSLINNI